MRATDTLPSSLTAAQRDSGFSGTVHSAGWWSTAGGSFAAARAAVTSTSAGARDILIRPSDVPILPEGRAYFQVGVFRYVSLRCVVRTISMLHDCVPSFHT